MSGISKIAASVAFALLLALGIAYNCSRHGDSSMSVSSQHDSPGGSRSEQTVHPQEVHEEARRERGDSSVRQDMTLRTLNSRQSERVEKALDVYRGHLKDLEFANARLEWTKDYEDRGLRLYVIEPASKIDIKEAEKATDWIISDFQMDKNERAVFSSCRRHALSEFLNSNKNGGALFLKIPKDVGKDIIAIEVAGLSDASQIIRELETSGGMNASFGNNLMHRVPRTNPGWRYDRFLMVAEE
jgi:hypothetical protein